MNDITTQSAALDEAQTRTDITGLDYAVLYINSRYHVIRAHDVAPYDYKYAVEYVFGARQPRPLL